MGSVEEINAGTLTLVDDGSKTRPPIETNLNNSPGSSTTNDKKTLFKFTLNDEIKLLKEVMVHEVYKCRRGDVTSTWKKIVKICGDKYQFETARRHYANMMEKFMNDDALSLRKSGTEEEYDEKMTLLQDLRDQTRDFDNSKSKKIELAKEKDSKIKGEEIRDAAMKGLVKITRQVLDDEAESDGAPQLHAKKRKTDTVFNFMAKQNELKEKQLQIDERKQALEEKKWEEGAEERKMQAEERKLQVDERKMMMEILLKKFKD